MKKPQHGPPRRGDARSSPGGKAHRDVRGPRRISPGAPAKYPAERVISGVHSILEALKTHSRDCVELWTADQKILPKIFELANRISLKVRIVPEDELKKFGQHQGLILFAHKRPELVLDLLTKTHSTLLILDEIEDPHNLGAILRTSWLMGVDGLVMSNRRTVSLSAAAHKVASGGAEHVSILSVSTFAPTFQLLKEKGYWIFGLSGQATKTISQIQIPEKVAWVLGAEENGMRTTTEKLCDELVSLPQITVDASYNVSVATAMALAYQRSKV